MADNTRGGSESGTAPLIATDEVTYSGDVADVQLMRIVGVTGAEGSKTVDALSDEDGLYVKLRDESGGPLVTGVQYIEDSAITADLGQGTLVVGRRDDALSTLTPVEGDAIGLRVGATGALWVQPEGNVAHDGADSGSPIKIGGKANANSPTNVSADNDRVDAWFTRQGAQVVTLENPEITAVTARYTTTQTSTILGPTNGAGTKPVVTAIQIQAGGTTAGEVIVYFGTGAYSRGTNRAIFDGEFAPSATLKPGYAQSPPVSYEGASGDEIRVTTSAAIDPLTVTVWYHLVTV